ncbi:MAG: hypothetical protein GC181_02105 [Bacteroidetes bacterium]|nr:hypothetical protein [Bacteroidota bacterium]
MTKNIRIQLALVLVSAFALYACKGRKAAVKSDDKKENTVSIQILYTSNPCGGAQPTPDIVEEMQRPKPYTQKEIWIAPFMKESEAIKYKTDKEGKLNIAIDTGFYQVYVYNPVPLVAVSDSVKRSEKEDCERMFKLEQKAPLGILKNTPPAEVILNLMCNPCEEPKP